MTLTKDEFLPGLSRAQTAEMSRLLVPAVSDARLAFCPADDHRIYGMPNPAVGKLTARGTEIARQHIFAERLAHAARASLEGDE